MKLCLMRRRILVAKSREKSRLVHGKGTPSLFNEMLIRLHTRGGTIHNTCEEEQQYNIIFNKGRSSLV